MMDRPRRSSRGTTDSSPAKERSEPPTKKAKAGKGAKTSVFKDFDVLCVNSIRALGAEMPTLANSGHPGAPIGMAPIAHVLWTHFMAFDSSDAKWPNRDRFILSNGHACALNYAMLHLLGYNVTKADLKQFRKVGSITPGHPEVGHTDGIEVTTGPLGQGLANGVGMAIAQAHLAAHFNKPVNLNPKRENSEP
jgi:transketolase